MSARKIAILAMVCVVGASWKNAHAETSTNHDLFLRKHEVSLNVGLASALGVGGVAYAYSFVPWLAAEAGVGYGGSGLQISGMLKPSLNIGSGPHRLLVGAVGVSVGLAKPDTNGGFLLFTTYDLADDTTFVWLNVDAIGYTRRFGNGMFITAAAGVTVGLAGEYYKLEEPQGGNPSAESKSTLGLVAPQGRFAFGYAF